MKKSKSKKISESLQVVMDQTNTPANQWEFLDGPVSGVGVESWYRNKKTGQEAYCVLRREKSSL